MFGVRSWLTPMHSTNSLAASFFFAEFSPMVVDMAERSLGPVQMPRASRASPSCAMARWVNSPPDHWRPGESRDPSGNRTVSGLVGPGLRQAFAGMTIKGGADGHHAGFAPQARKPSFFRPGLP